MARPQSMNREGRGGLSRAAVKKMQGARRSHDGDLLADLFGQTAQHFKDHPLDGEAIISAVPAVKDSGQRGPAQPQISADDPVADVADWFKGSGREGAQRSAPEATKPSSPKAPDLAAAVAAAQAGLALDANPSDQSILVGLPGEDYISVLDELGRPPNTSMY